MKPIELTGQRFGRLIVLDRAENDRFGKARWRCQCDCGKETTTRSNTLLKGETLSCGCLFQEKRALGSKRSHGQSKTALYSVWSVAKGRCENPTDKNYRYYGGRGITMCDRWRRSFTDFQADMGPRPEGYTLGRINNDGPYAPENCRWETYKQQARNTRRTFLVSHEGTTQTIGAWAEQLGIDEHALYFRIRTAGWSIKRALTTPSTPPKGEDHPGHKLSDAAVAEIRQAYAAGVTQATLAQQYGVGQGHVSRIVLNKVRH